MLNLRIRKRYYKTLGTSVTNSPLSPPSLDLSSYLFSKNDEPPPPTATTTTAAAASATAAAATADPAAAADQDGGGEEEAQPDISLQAVQQKLCPQRLSAPA